MTSRAHLLLLWFSIAGAVTADSSIAAAQKATLPEASKEEACTPCHQSLRDPRLQAPAWLHAASAHGRARVACSSCHRGRTDVSTVSAHDPATGFLPKPGPDACLACHEDDPAPKGSHLSAPSAYWTSAHGAATQKGRRGVAQCADCHTSHDVRPAEDPHGSLWVGNVVDTCGACHEDQARRYRTSVHAHRLEADPDAAAPVCKTCHDAHGMGRGEQGVDACGRCHTVERKAFDEGPHAKVFARMGFVDCAECHSNHGIRPARAERLLSRASAPCRRCHQNPEAASAVIEEHRRAIIEAERRARAWHEANPNEDPESEVEQIHERLHVAIHSLDAEGVERESAALLSTLDEAPEFLGIRAGASGLWALAVGLTVLVLGGLWVLFRRRRGGSS